MEIPIRFKFFDKLKLYQDYLKNDCMLEKAKSDYWLYEKAVMFWAYSPYHQHLGEELSVGTLTEKTRAETLVGIAKKIGRYGTRPITWVEKYRSNDRTIKKVIGNLLTLQLIDKCSDDRDKCGDDRQKFTVNLKGFLLGELLFETYEKPGFWSKNFRKYKLMLLAFYTTFVVLLLTVYIVFLAQLFQIIKPERIALFFKQSLGYSWWATITTCFLLYLGLRRIWEKI